MVNPPKEKTSMFGSKKEQLSSDVKELIAALVKGALDEYGDVGIYDPEEVRSHEDH